MIAPAGPQDTVDGVQASYLAKPREAQELVELMREAAEREETVVARGGGTKLDWGLPPSRADLLVDLSEMNHVLEHSAGDLIVRTEPGVRLSELQTLLARSGQRLAIDEVVPGSTIGGVVATGLCGPLRLAYGCVRDLLIGVRVVRADGVSAKSGGKVVKNVAGYDLGKLYTGSYGTLGIVTEAVFRLHPVPESRAWVTTEVSSDDEVVRAIAAVTSSRIVPAALEIDRPATGAPTELSVLVEGVAVGVERRGEEVARLLGGEVTISPSPPSWWAALPGATTVKIATTVSELPAVLSAIGERGSSRGAEPSLRGSAALGLLYVGLAMEAEPKAVAAFVTDMRVMCERVGGSAIVLRAPARVKEAVEVWGPVGSIDLMRRVKDNFDPTHRLAPGRFVGGI
ncbi:MAG: FAD-binding oxidoreductase [Acidimicrobiales bacterium]